MKYRIFYAVSDIAFALATGLFFVTCYEYIVSRPQSGALPLLLAYIWLIATSSLIIARSCIREGRLLLKWKVWFLALGLIAAVFLIRR